jgi:acetyl-CoA acyltransferase
MDAYIVDGVRSAIGNFGGTLAQVRADDLAAEVLRALLERNASMNAAAVADVVLGCANQAGEDNRNVARMALLLAGMPMSVPGETVNRLCASGMSAAIAAAWGLHAGEGNLRIAGGVEHMTRAPWVISKTSTAFGRDAQMFDSSFGWRFVNEKMHERYGTDAMGETAENLAEMYNISRDDQDAFAYHSQQKATAAQAKGIFAEEIVPISIPVKKGDAVLFTADEFIKPTTTLEKLSTLRPAFRKGGTVTAGNASGLNDGAAALLMASEKGLVDHALTPLVRIVSSAAVGVEPRTMGIGPVAASLEALRRAQLSLDQMDVIELNEAFAAQVLACTRQLGLADTDARLNINGGAIALGHPLGMSGARLLLTASRELQRSKKKYALCTMCIGVGQGYAVVLERVG